MKKRRSKTTSKTLVTLRERERESFGAICRSNNVDEIKNVFDATSLIFGKTEI